MIKIESTPNDTCRVNGLTVGSRLASNTKHGQVSIEITHICPVGMEARTLSDDKRGPSESVGMELQTWRRWEVLA